MRGIKRDRSARVIVRGHALMQNIRRGHYELGIDTRARLRVAAAFTELARASCRQPRRAPAVTPRGSRTAESCFVPVESTLGMIHTSSPNHSQSTTRRTA